MAKTLKQIYQENAARCKQLMDDACGEDMAPEAQAEFDRCAETCQTLQEAHPGIGRQVTPNAVHPNVPGATDNNTPGYAVFGEGNAMEFQQIGNCLKNPVRSFSGNRAESDKKALTFAHYCLAIAGRAASQGWCQQNGINLLALASGGVNTAGGYLVPDVLSRDLIQLRDSYGVFRQHAKYVQLTSDSLTIPRMTSDLTGYFVSEGGQITESSKAWDAVKLVLKKIAVLSRFTNEIAADALISVGDDLADSIAWTVAYKEDLAGFLGDGTSTYGGIVGLTHKLSALNGVDDGGGLVLATGNAYSEIVFGDFAAMLARVKPYARKNSKWFCSSAFWATTMLRLAYAAGGVSANDITGGIDAKFIGYPVVFAEALPQTEANSQICCFFGDLRLASTFGDRGGIQIATSTDATINGEGLFERDSMAIRGVERFDVNVHDVGTASAAGPVVGLITKAS